MKGTKSERERCQRDRERCQRDAKEERGEKIGEMAKGEGRNRAQCKKRATERENRKSAHNIPFFRAKLSVSITVLIITYVPVRPIPALERQQKKHEKKKA